MEDNFVLQQQEVEDSFHTGEKGHELEQSDLQEYNQGMGGQLHEVYVQQYSRHKLSKMRNFIQNLLRASARSIWQ